MALSDAEIVRQNPWWEDRAWAARDHHLTSLPEGVVLPQPVFAREIMLGDESVHVVRGPRQVGKSTGLKLLARRCLVEEGVAPLDVIYLSLDLLEDQPIATVAATINRAKELAGGTGPCLLLLDEVTTVPKWARAVKALWDAGTIRRDTVVCTGSSAVDLAVAGAESMPGRRGKGIDYLVLPQTFAAFARAVDPLVPESPAFTLADIFTDPGRGALERALASVPRLDKALERYLAFGGLPAAVTEAASGARSPSAATKRVLWDSIGREVQRRGASEVALRALLERVAVSLSAKTNWSTLAREMDVPVGGKKRPPDYRSVKDYIEFLCRNYFLMVVHFWKAKTDSSDLGRDKKIYFGDPLLQAVALEHAPGVSVGAPAAVENAVALALYRRYEPDESKAGGFVDPRDVHSWETTKPREIDFVCGPRAAPDLAEVKYRASARISDTLVMRNAFPGRPAVLVTKEDLRLAADYALVPAPLLLWALG